MKTRLLSALGLLAFLIWNPYPLQVLELKTFDWLMSTKPAVQDEMIILVDIDEEFVEAVELRLENPWELHSHTLQELSTL